MTHVTDNEEIESLRAQLAEVTRERDEYAERRCEVCGYAEHHREHTGCLRKQLLATQAHAARLVDALVVCEPLAAYGRPGTRDVEQTKFQAAIKAALSTPINFDALHEDRAQVLDDATKVAALSSEVAANAIRVMAEAHRAKKEGK